MRIKLVIILFTSVANFYIGCDLLQPTRESPYYLLHSNGKTELYRLNDIVALIYEDNINAVQADSVIDLYNLVPIKMFGNESYNVDWEAEEIILVRLPHGANLENYLSSFPRTGNNKFGDLPEIKFSLPVFAFDNSGNPHARFIINDELIISSKVDSLRTLEILNHYKLEFARRSLGGEYVFKITHDSPYNTLEISNKVYNHSDFNWSMPNGYAYISFGSN